MCSLTAHLQCSQCQQIYGDEEFVRIYDYLKQARSQPAQGVDEGSVVAGLKPLTTNLRDCFLVDQLVFLEKQEGEGEGELEGVVD